MLRITGLATGLDTDEMVQKLMKVELMKADQYKQKIQSMEWQRDNYREITSLLKGFQDEYFDVLKPEKNMRSISSYSAFATTYNGTETSPYLTIKPNANAKAGTYTIKNVVTAKTAKATGTALAGGIKGDAVSSFSINNTSDNNKITVTLNGASKIITLENNPADITALKNDLQSKIDSAFGSGKVTVGNDLDQLTFSTANTNTLSFSYAYNDGYSKVLGTKPSFPLTLDYQSNKIKVTLDSTPQTIELTPATYNDMDALLQEIQNRVDTAFGTGNIRVLNQSGSVVLKPIGSSGSVATPWDTVDISGGVTIDDSNNSMEVTVAGTTKTITLENKTYTKDELLSAIQSKLDSSTAFGSGKAMVSLDGSGHLRFEEISATAKLSTAKTENGGLEALGLKNVNSSNKISLNSNIADIKDNFTSPLTLTNSNGDVEGYDIEFSVNDEVFKFKSSETTINEIISAVNNNSKANAKMSYDELNDRIVVESKDLGVTAKVKISDIDGNFMGVLGLNGINNTGSDASMVFNDGSGEQTIVRSTNSFTLNNLNFELKADNNPGSVEVKIASNTQATYDLIKGFVDKYNEVLDKINLELTEKRYRNYRPLTEEQKKEMKDADIELWENKAKSGLLRSDSILEKIVSNMRRALYDTVKDVDTSLSEIGITSSPLWEDRGKLVINETKLKDAIAQNPDKLVQLFSKESQYSYQNALDDSAKRATRYEESGLAQRLYDILQDNIRITRDKNGRKGTLLEKAGTVNDLTDTKNVINSQIEAEQDKLDRLLDKLVDKENYYYNMFARMETAIQQMNAQSAWLTQQFSGR